MYTCKQFFINGQWLDPAVAHDFPVINPATEQPVGVISLGSTADLNRAVAAAKAAFPAYGVTRREERVELLESILAVYDKRYDDIATAISDEMGAPLNFAKTNQAACGTGHLKVTIEALKELRFEQDLGATRIVREPVGVCGFITPWNWPINQIACKVAPALAAGCTMVLKPSEIAPLSAYVWTEVLDEAGVPAGVYNMVNGDGPGIGAPLSAHPDIDMVSFTGSTRAGVLVAKAAADTVKRVAQELGGKSPNLILEDADLERAVRGGVLGCMSNTGQSCNAPTRMLVPRARQDQAVAIAKAAAEAIPVGDPRDPGTRLGPVVSETQFNKIQTLINKGIEEGAVLVTGGPGRPRGLDAGYYVQPTVFADVTNYMTIAREEIFGPVLAIMPYDSEAEAIAMANDTPYGLSSYVSSGDLDHARAVAAQLRTGMVHLNGADTDFHAPFGGYKQSGNGREWGAHGIDEFLEVKSIYGFEAP
jgi:aldehyde dehydrogenase (NAD+)